MKHFLTASLALVPLAVHAQSAPSSDGARNAHQGDGGDSEHVRPRVFARRQAHRVPQQSQRHAAGVDGRCRRRRAEAGHAGERSGRLRRVVAGRGPHCIRCRARRRLQRAGVLQQARRHRRQAHHQRRQGRQLLRQLRAGRPLLVPLRAARPAVARFVDLRSEGRQGVDRDSVRRRIRRHQRHPAARQSRVGRAPRHARQHQPVPARPADAQGDPADAARGAGARVRRARAGWQRGLRRPQPRARSSGRVAHSDRCRGQARCDDAVRRARRRRSR